MLNSDLKVRQNDHLFIKLVIIKLTYVFDRSNRFVLQNYYYSYSTANCRQIFSENFTGLTTIMICLPGYKTMIPTLESS